MNIEPEKAASRLAKLVPNPKAKLRDQFHEVARFKYLARRTEETYWQWVVRHFRFHRRNGPWRHPRELQAQADGGVPFGFRPSIFGAAPSRKNICLTRPHARR